PVKVFLCSQAFPRLYGAGQQVLQVIVDASYAKLRLGLERVLDVVGAFRLLAIYQHDGKDEFLALVEAGENLVLGHSDGGRTLSSALYLNVAIITNGIVRTDRWAGSDVPSTFLRGYIEYFVTQSLFCGHNG